jgi:hypothetical protein
MFNYFISYFVWRMQFLFATISLCALFSTFGLECENRYVLLNWLFYIIKNSLPILEEDPDMKKILDSSKIIKSKRQNPCLKSILTKTCFSSNNDETPTVSKCNKPNCTTCPYLTPGSDFDLKNGSKIIYQMSYMW